MLYRGRHFLLAVASLVTLAVGIIVLAEHGAKLRALAMPSSSAPTAGAHRDRRRKPAHEPRSRQRVVSRSPASARPASRAGTLVRRAPLYLALLGWAGALAVGIGTACTVDRRLRHRLGRDYRRYEIKLSMHDDAKPEDLEDMVEALGAAVRRRYSDRVSDGQPFIALELWHRASPTGMHWAPCLVCEASVTRTIEGIIASAYPDVRVGREFEEEPEACPWPLAEPRYVMRFRKRRSFIHPLGHPAHTSAAVRGRTTPLTEAIAMTQVAVGAPSLVRLQLTPASEQLEDRARRGLERRERRRAGGRHADRPARAGSTLEQAEMRAAVEVRHGSMFYLEVQIGSTDWETCNRIAASVVARRGENHLHRRYMVARQRLYRRRFPTAYPPLLPPLSLRTLVSAGELGHLFQLPSARMKSVPVRRLTIPRMPAPPDAFRATELEAPAAPGSAPASKQAEPARRGSAVPTGRT